MKFREIVRRKVRGHGDRKHRIQRPGPGSTGVGRGRLRAARALVFDTIGDIWDMVCHGDELSLEQRARMVLATNQAMCSAQGRTSRVFRLAGADAVFFAHPLQRCFRDIHAPTSSFSSVRVAIWLSRKFASGSTCTHSCSDQAPRRVGVLVNGARLQQRAHSGTWVAPKMHSRCRPLVGGVLRRVRPWVGELKRQRSAC